MCRKVIMIRIRDSVRIPGRVDAVWWILGFNVLAFMATVKIMASQNINLFWSGGVIPVEFTNREALVDWLYQAWRSGQFLIPRNANPEEWLADYRAPAILCVFWAMFLHQGFLHLFFNAFTLYLFGVNVEAVMGRTRFLLFYFGCGAFGFLAQVLFSPSSIIPIIGASGAISGCLGAYMALFPDHYIRITLGRRFNHYRDFMLPIRPFIIIWLISQLLHTFLPGSANVAFMAHVGGFFCGYFIARGKGRPGRSKFKVFDGGIAGG